MSLSSLRSFTDTARSTFKAMAEAAVPPANPENAPGAPVTEVEQEAERTPEQKRKAGIRKGLALDAYA